EMEGQLDIITERLQPVGIAVDRVLLANMLIKSARQWEKTFDNIEEPIAIINQDYEVLRSNKNFRNTKKLGKCYEIFAGLSTPCQGCPLQETLAQTHASKSSIKRGPSIY